MARITEATRNLLRKKVLEKSDDKRNALKEEYDKLSNSLYAEEEKMKAKAVALITEEFDRFNKSVAQILKTHCLTFAINYSSNSYTVENIIGSRNGEAFITKDAASKFDAVRDKNDKARKRLDNLRADIDILDIKRQKACEDIELRVALGAKFDEVVELINNLQF